MNKKKNNLIQKISLERMHRLIELAEKEFKKHPERSKNYIKLIKRIGSKNNVRIPIEIKEKFCKKCNAFLKKGVNAKLRIKEKNRWIYCLECGFIRKLKTKQ